MIQLLILIYLFCIPVAFVLALYNDFKIQNYMDLGTIFIALFVAVFPVLNLWYIWDHLLKIKIPEIIKKILEFKIIDRRKK